MIGKQTKGMMLCKLCHYLAVAGKKLRTNLIMQVKEDGGRKKKGFGKGNNKLVVSREWMGGRGVDGSRSRGLGRKRKRQCSWQHVQIVGRSKE